MIATVEEPVALHIRRTDYLKLDHHNSLGLDYYEKALGEFDSDRTIIICLLYTSPSPRDS